MKNFTTKTASVFILMFVACTNIMFAQDNDQQSKTLYRSYFGNESTRINMTHVPCYSSDLYYDMSGVIYNRDTIRKNGKRYYYRAPQPLGIISEPVDHYLFPRKDTLFLREERETGRLYRYYNDYFGMGPTEKLICDMTLEVGDEFVFLKTFPDCLGEVTYTVYSVSYNNGIKTICLYGSGGYETCFEEGIFPQRFPLWQEQLYEWSSNELGSMQQSDLRCEYKDDVLVYSHPGGCWLDPMDVEETKNNETSIYPNVINVAEIITIETKDYIKDVAVRDVLGRTCAITKNIVDDNKWQIRVLSSCDSGMYFIIVQKDKGFDYEKVMVLD